jgi:hypothetical protein
MLPALKIKGRQSFFRGPLRVRYPNNRMSGKLAVLSRDQIRIYANGKISFINPNA